MAKTVGMIVGIVETTAGIAGMIVEMIVGTTAGGAVAVRVMKSAASVMDSIVGRKIPVIAGALTQTIPAIIVMAIAYTAKVSAGVISKGIANTVAVAGAGKQN